MLKKYRYNGHEILPPKSDIVFKALFGAEKNKNLLAAFLRDMLDLDIPDGSCIELLNTELTPETTDEKIPRLDIRAKLKSGKEVNIEIQLKNVGNTAERIIAYNSKILVSQLTRGMDYSSLKKCISLAILDFSLFPQEENWYNKYRFINTISGNELSDLAEIIFVEMGKLNKTLSAEHLQGQHLDKKERWTLFLATDSEEVLHMLSEKDVNIAEAMELLQYISSNPKLQYEIDMIEKAESDYYSGLAHAERCGLEQGLEMGKQQATDRTIEAYILDNRQDGIAKHKTLEKLMKLFALSSEEAENCYKKYE